jgi:anti-sigma B factor antagonist
VGPDGRLVVAGELDIATAGAFRDALCSLAPASLGRIVVDLRAVSFMDSSGVAALLNEHRHLEAAGVVLVIAGASRPVRSVLRVLAVDSLFVMEEPIDAADS